MYKDFCCVELVQCIDTCIKDIRCIYVAPLSSVCRNTIILSLRGQWNTSYGGHIYLIAYYHHLVDNVYFLMFVPAFRRQRIYVYQRI